MRPRFDVDSRSSQESIQDVPAHGPDHGVHNQKDDHPGIDAEDDDDHGQDRNTRQQVKDRDHQIENVKERPVHHSEPRTRKCQDDADDKPRKEQAQRVKNVYPEGIAGISGCEISDKCSPDRLQIREK